MKLKKIVLLCIILHSLPTYATHTDHELRTKGLVYAGLILVSAGTYQLCKQDQQWTSKIAHTLSGVCLIAIGASSILLSNELVKELDRILHT